MLGWYSPVIHHMRHLQRSSQKFWWVWDNQGSHIHWMSFRFKVKTHHNNYLLTEWVRKSVNEWMSKGTNEIMAYVFETRTWARGLISIFLLGWSQEDYAENQEPTAVQPYRVVLFLFLLLEGCPSPQNSLASDSTYQSRIMILKMLCFPFFPTVSEGDLLEPLLFSLHLSPHLLPPHLL